MSQRAFQAALARLVTEPAFRRHVRTGDGHSWADELTEKERRQLAAVAGDRGIDVTASLIESFRLGKIVSLMPFTRRILGDPRLLREARRFWEAQPPVTFYFVEEAVAFCDFLRARSRAGLRVSYLEEVVAYERASLELRRIRAEGHAPIVQRLRFRHDPVALFTSLTAGRRPHRVPRLRRVLDLVVSHDGRVRLADPTRASFSG